MDIAQISILLHNYNHVKNLSRSLTAIQNQTVRPYEVLILDDGSTDGSIEIIESFLKNNSHFKFYKNAVNKGILYSVNRLLTLATGDFIVSTASDDILLPKFVERYLEVVKNNTDVDLIHSCGANFSTDMDIQNSLKLDKFKISDAPIHTLTTKYMPQDFTDRCKLGYITICSNTVMCRRQLLVDYGGFDELLKWHTDWFAFYSIALRHKSLMLNEYLTLYHIHDNSYHKQGMQNPIKQSQVINAIFNKILQPENKDLLNCFIKCPNLLTLFKPSLLLRCTFNSKNNLTFLIPTLRYITYKPIESLAMIKNNLYLRIQANFPIIYKILKNIKNRIKVQRI